MIKYLYTILALAVCLPFPASAQDVLECIADPKTGKCQYCPVNPETGKRVCKHIGKVGRDVFVNVIMAGKDSVEFGKSGDANKGSVKVVRPDHCGAGKYLVGASCRKCPAGTYSTGTITNAEGKKEDAAIRECTPCGPGTYAKGTGNTKCLPCPAGEYSEGEGSSQCKPCPAGSYSVNEGNNHCSPCEVGKQCPRAGMTTSEKCAPGTYAAGTGNKECLSCPAGTYSEGGKEEIDISGKIIVTGVFECTPCAPGTFSEGIANSACTPCAPGEYAAGTGNTSCLSCPAGTYSKSDGTPECTPCEQGKKQDKEGQEACVPCEAGKYAAGSGNTFCTDCAAGTYSSGTGAAYCELCEAGKFAEGTGNTTCKNCGIGTYADSTGSTQCTVCPAGTHSNEVLGPDGKKHRISCVPCAPGYHQSESGQTYCSICPAGTFSTGGAMNCTPCSVGMYQDKAGQKECKACENGKTSGAIENGEWAGWGAKGCTTCPSGQYLAGTSCKACGAGCAVCTDERVCEVCKPGFDLLENKTCSTCGKGEYYNAERKKCSPCKDGTYSDIEGAAQCKPCSEKTPGCKLCNNITGQCMECMSGFALNVHKQCDSRDYEVYVKDFGIGRHLRIATATLKYVNGTDEVDRDVALASLTAKQRERMGCYFSEGAIMCDCRQAVVGGKKYQTFRSTQGDVCNQKYNDCGKDFTPEKSCQKTQGAWLGLEGNDLLECVNLNDHPYCSIGLLETGKTFVIKWKDTDGSVKATRFDDSDYMTSGSNHGYGPAWLHAHYQHYAKYPDNIENRVQMSKDAGRMPSWNWPSKNPKTNQSDEDKYTVWRECVGYHFESNSNPNKFYNVFDGRMACQYYNQKQNPELAYEEINEN